MIARYVTNTICRPHYACLKSRLYYQNMHSTNMDIKTFMFLDLETTGLPYLENNRTRITELCLIAVRSHHIASGVFPRVQNKLSLCLNPRKFIDIEASNITGLTNDNLEYQPIFDDQTFLVIRDFINLQQKPVCFVAHNGNAFDYPILQSEIHKCGKELENSILCVDSLLAFRDLHHIESKTDNGKSQEIPVELQDGYDDLLCSVLDEIESNSNFSISIEEIQKINESTPIKNIIRNTNTQGKNANTSSSSKRKLIPRNVSFKLSEVYKRLTNIEPKDLHKAECDVNMLIQCAAVLSEQFVNWCNMNSKPFCEIPPLKPRIGIS